MLDICSWSFHFIDGLDGYDGESSHIMKVTQTMASSLKININCIGGYGALSKSPLTQPPELSSSTT